MAAVWPPGAHGTAGQVSLLILIMLLLASTHITNGIADNTGAVDDFSSMSPASSVTQPAQCGQHRCTNSTSSTNSTNSDNSDTARYSNQPHFNSNKSTTTTTAGRFRRAVTREKKPILNEFSFPSSLVQGMRFVLMCTILDGDAPINIKWFKDGAELSNKNSIDIELSSAGELGSTLVFRRVHQSQTGNYTCLASNQAGQASFTSFMSVKVPPRWKLEPTDQFAIIGDTVVIDCQAEGNPAPFIRWKQSVMPLSSDLHAHFSSKLSRSSLQSADNSSSSSMHKSLSSPADERHHQLGSSINMMIDNNNILANNNNHLESSGPDNQLVSLELAFERAQEDQQQQQQHQLHQQMQSNFKLINSNHYMQSLENGSLSIRMINKENEGYYMCEADNGVEPNLSKIVKLIAHHQASFKNGHLFKLIKLLHNEQIKLDCQPIGDKPLTVQWFKDGQPISLPLDGSKRHSVSDMDSYASNQRFHFDTRDSEDGLSSDAIGPSAQRSDSALYSCLAKNNFGSSERKLRVVVMERPDKPEQVDIVQVSSRSISLRWLAPFDGNSPITRYQFEYKRHKEPWSAATTIEFAAAPVGPMLTNLGGKIYSVTNDRQQTDGLAATGSSMDQGTTSNNNNNNNQILIDANQSPYTHLMSQTGSDSQVSQHQTIVMDVPSGQLQGGATLTGNSLTTVTASANQQQQSQAAANNNKQTIQHSIQSLQPLTRYSIRVSAINAIGKSGPSVALDIRTEEEVPSIQPRHVKAQVLSSRSVKLSWTITFAPAHDLIEGFFLGYRSRATSQSGNGIQETPSYTYKTIKLMNSGSNFRLTRMHNNDLGANNNDYGSIQNHNQLIINGSSNNNNLFSSDNNNNNSNNNNNLAQQKQQQTLNDKTSSSIYLSPISSSLATTGTNSMVSPSGSGLQASQKEGDQLAEMQAGLVSGVAIGTPSARNNMQQQQQFATNLQYSDNGRLVIMDSNNIDQNYNSLQQLESLAPYYAGNVSNLLVISTFEYVITNLERNTDYSILLQCYNRKGAGPASEPLLLRTFVNDPPEKLALTIDEVTESSAKLSWRFIANSQDIDHQLTRVVSSSLAGSTSITGHYKTTNSMELPLTTTMGIYNGQQPSSPGGLSLLSNSSRNSVAPLDGFILSFALMTPTASTTDMSNMADTTARGKIVVSPLLSTNGAQLDNDQRPSSGDNQSKSSTATNKSDINGVSAPPSATNKLTAPASGVAITPNQWQSIQLPAQQRSYHLKSLDCGTSYALWIMAFNKVGKGEPSDMLTLTTRGKAPVAPDKRSFLTINVTQVRLHLSAWYDGGCEIDHFMIQYKPRLQEEWVTLSDNILREQVSVVIRDLLPGTWHDLLVTAKNQVGLTDIKYRFATLNVDGSTVQPLPQDLLSAQQSNGADSNGDDKSADDRGRNPNNSLDLLWRGWHWSWRQLFNDPLIFIPVLCTLFVLASILSFALFIFVVRWRQKRLLTHLVVSSATATNNCHNNPQTSLHHHQQHQQHQQQQQQLSPHHMNIHGSPLTSSNSQHNSNASSPKNGLNTRNHISNYQQQHQHHMHINASNQAGHLYDTMHTINQQHYHNQQLTLRQQQQSNSGQQLLACPDSQQQIAMGDTQLINGTSCQIGQQQYNQQQQTISLNNNTDLYGTLRPHEHVHSHLIQSNHHQSSPHHNNSNTVAYYATGNQHQGGTCMFPPAGQYNSNNNNNSNVDPTNNGDALAKQVTMPNQTAFDELTSSLNTSYDRMAQRLLLNGYATLNGNSNGGINGKRSNIEAALHKSHQLNLSNLMNQQQTDDISLNAYSVNNNSASKYASSSTSAFTSATASTTTTTSVDASIITNNSQQNVDQNDNVITSTATDSSSGYNSFANSTNHRSFNGMAISTDQQHQLANGDATMNDLLHYNYNKHGNTATTGSTNNNNQLDGDQNHFLSEAAFDSMAEQLLASDDCQLSSISMSPEIKKQPKESTNRLDYSNNNKQFGSNADETAVDSDKVCQISTTTTTIKDNIQAPATKDDDGGVQRNIHNWFNAAATDGAIKGSVLLRLSPAKQIIPNNLVDLNTKVGVIDRDHIYDVPYKYKHDQLKQQQHMTINFDRSKLQSVCRYN